MLRTDAYREGEESRLNAYMYKNLYIIIITIIAILIADVHHSPAVANSRDTNISSRRFPVLNPDCQAIAFSQAIALYATP